MMASSMERNTLFSVEGMVFVVTGGGTGRHGGLGCW